MAVFSNEIELTNYFAEEIKGQYKKVFPNVNPASHDLYEFWQEWFGQEQVVAQPQLDLIMVPSNLDILTAELKYFRGRRPDSPFYAGIEEALASLRFGAVCVSLLHFFDQTVPDETIRKFVTETRNLILNLNLPINYEAFKCIRKTVDDQVQRQITYLHTDFSESERFPSLYGKSNPYHEADKAKRMQDFLRKALSIPSKSIS